MTMADMGLDNSHPKSSMAPDMVAALAISSLRSQARPMAIMPPFEYPTAETRSAL